MVNRLERATEVVLWPKDKMFGFEPGQFAFITIDADGFREAHPFTISSGAGEDRLRFTMKVLGDYTRRIRDGLTAGAEVAVEGRPESVLRLRPLYAWPASPAHTEVLRLLVAVWKRSPVPAPISPGASQAERDIQQT